MDFKGETHISRTTSHVLNNNAMLARLQQPKLLQMSRELLDWLKTDAMRVASESPRVIASFRAISWCITLWQSVYRMIAALPLARAGRCVMAAMTFAYTHVTRRLAAKIFLTTIYLWLARVVFFAAVWSLAWLVVKVTLVMPLRWFSWLVQ